MPDDDPQNLLDEYIEPNKRSSRWYIPLMILILLFICVFNLIYYYNVRSLSGGIKLEGTQVFMTVIIPGAALILLYLQKKAGWILASSYFMTIGCVIAGTMAWLFRRAGTSDVKTDPMIEGRQLFICILFLLILCCLVSPTIRRQFRIGNILFISILLVSISLGALIAFVGLGKN